MVLVDGQTERCKRKSEPLQAPAVRDGAGPSQSCLGERRGGAQGRNGIKAPDGTATLTPIRKRFALSNRCCISDDRELGTIWLGRGR